jgi:hypothetical protein
MPVDTITGEFTPDTKPKSTISDVHTKAKYYWRQRHGNDNFESLIEFSSFVGRNLRFQDPDYYNSHIQFAYENYFIVKKKFGTMERYYEFHANKDYAELDYQTYNFINQIPAN